jgi:ketosteroid isomerase-like protein/nicotinamidase-related amidase
MKDKNTQANNPNELTIENSVLVLIDHQPWIALMVHSIDPGLMINNVAGLAQAAKNLGVPTILTTIGAKGSILVDPLFKEISEIFPDVTPIDRTSTHAWSHPEVRAAIDATGRKKLIMAGLVTEVCLAQSVLAAQKDGYEVYFVPNCSGGATVEAHEDAKARMVQAGAKPISWLAVTSEWVPDYKAPERAAVGGVWSRRGGGLGLLSDYVLAQVTAGLVPMPSFTSAPGKAGPAQAPTDRQTDTDAINRLAEEMLSAFETKDSAKVNTYYAPGAVLATPGRPAAKDARALTKAIKDDIADPNLKITVSNEKTEVSGSGDMAYRRGSFKITTTNPQTKQAEQSEGTYLAVFRKQADGSWKIAEDFGV